MTEEPKKADLTSLFTSSDDVTGEQMLQNLIVDDKNLDLKTRIKQPTVIMTMDVLKKSSKERGFTKTTQLLKWSLRSYRKNFVSQDGLSREEIVNSWVALMEANQRKREGLADQLFGGSKR